jgi:hypothetical protein
MRRRKPTRQAIRSVVAVLAVSAGLLVPLAVFGGPALANGISGATAAYQYQYKVVVCHPTGSKKHPFRTIRVAPKAVAAAIKGGGHRGACLGNEKPKPKHKAKHSRKHHGKR